MSEIRYSFCRLCEGICGIEVTLEDGHIREVRPDWENPLSRGFLCIKGRNAHHIVEDKLRVLRPRRRDGDRWREAAWNEAFVEIARRLKAIQERHGTDAVALYLGNPTAMSAVASYVASAFMRAIGSPRQYSAMTLDNMNKFFVAEAMLGDKSFILQRDWESARYMLVLGHNPRVSIFGQLSTRPRGLEELRHAQAHGAKLVLVDPRRTETATIADEHLRIRPGTDIYLLLALLNEIVSRGLYDRGFVERYCSGFDALARAVSPFTPERADAATGIGADTIRRIARELAAAEGAFVLGATGVTQQRYATVNEWAIEALNAVTGNIDRPGGAFFNPGVVDEPHLKQAIEWDKPSRIGGYPRVLGEHPVATLADEITTPGPGQIRALIVTAGNPLATSPDTERLRAAFEQLDLLIVIDLYHSATAELAHWLLPATSFFERQDINIQFTRHTPFPFVQFTDRIVPPQGDAREEWDIFRGLGNAMGTPFLGSPALAGEVCDVAAFYRDFLARRGRVSLEEVKRHPHGVKLGEKPISAFRDLLERQGRRIDLVPEAIIRVLPAEDEFGALADGRYPYRLISRRDLRSVCSWLHLSGSGERRNELEISRQDADRLGIANGAMVRVKGEAGALLARAKVSDAVTAGVVSLQYGLSTGLRAPGTDRGVTMNSVISATAARDPLTGMPTLNGVPVAIEAVS